MNLLFSHPTGNANVRALATSLASAGMLHSFFTTVATFPSSWHHKLSAVPPFNTLRKRAYSNQLRSYTKCDPVLEMGRIVAEQMGWQKLTRHESGRMSIDAVCRRLDQRVAKYLDQATSHAVNAIYAYEDVALASFLRARALGLPCFYDLPIGYWRAARSLMEAEKQRLPDWASTIPGLSDSEAKLDRKDQELQLASHIFVASSFTARTLDSFDGHLPQVSIIPYGFPPVPGKITARQQPTSPLKLLFVGSLSQRKGIADLFWAAKKLANKVTLTIVGRRTTHSCPPLERGLETHRYIPALEHGKILQLMQQHDVLVFPSLFEGSGLVITEAMSQGLPVITTPHTIGGDIIRHGENGWLVPPGNPEALADTISQLLKDPSQIRDAGFAAMHTAAQRPWQQYGAEMIAALKQHLPLP